MLERVMHNAKPAAEDRARWQVEIEFVRSEFESHRVDVACVSGATVPARRLLSEYLEPIHACRRFLADLC